MDEMESERDASIGTRAENENWSIVRDELHRQSHHLRTVEAANAKLNSELTTLRARHQMVEVLKEEKRNLEKKLKKAEEVKDKVVKLEGEVEAARKERADWYAKPIKTFFMPLTFTYQG
jgi:mitotic spindle assembly checkpoint protein MAD1